MKQEELFKELKKLFREGIAEHGALYEKHYEKHYKLTSKRLDSVEAQIDVIVSAVKVIRATQHDHERRLQVLERGRPKNSLSRFL